MKLSWPLLSYAVLIFGLLGCGGSKKLTSKGDFSPESFESFFLTIDHIEINGKLRIMLPAEGMSYNTNITTRMNQDSIWMIGKFIGLEAFRALVTHDSIHILNRLNKEYLYGSWTDIQQKYNPDLSFYSLRNLLLGNPFIVQGKKYQLFKNKEVYEFDYTTPDAKLYIDILYKDRIKESAWLMESPELLVESKYSKYNNDNLKNIPYFRSYIANFSNTQDINIELEVKNFSFNDQLKLPFEVPSRYSTHALVSIP